MSKCPWARLWTCQHLSWVLAAVDVWEGEAEAHLKVLWIKVQHKSVYQFIVKRGSDCTWESFLSRQGYLLCWSPCQRCGHVTLLLGASDIMNSSWLCCFYTCDLVTSQHPFSCFTFCYFVHLQITIMKAAARAPFNVSSMCQLCNNNVNNVMIVSEGQIAAVWSAAALLLLCLKFKTTSDVNNPVTT